MNKEEIVSQVKKYYPFLKEKGSLSVKDYRNSPEIKRLQSLLKMKYGENEKFLNIPKWFVLNKWPKPIYTRQANIPDLIWPYFSIWIHDIVSGVHYTISSSHIIPYFLIYKWKNETISEEGFDYIGEQLNREEYFNNLKFEEFNPSSVVGISLKDIEKIYLKYLGTKLFKNLEILDETIPEIYFEGKMNRDFLIQDLFDGVTEHKLNKPYIDELGSGLI